MSDGLEWFRSVFDGGLTPGGRTVEDFDAALAEHDRELSDRAHSAETRVADLERRLAASQRLGLAAIFLADTLDGDDPDGDLRRMRDEWLAPQLDAARAEVVDIVEVHGLLFAREHFGISQ